MKTVKLQTYRGTIETIRFGDENDYKYEIWFKSLNGSLYFFSLEKLALLTVWEEGKPSPDRKMLTFDNLMSPLQRSC